MSRASQAIRAADELQQRHAWLAVLGLIAWLYLEAELTLYAVEINVVLTYRLWPRSITPSPYTGPDRRAFERYAQLRQRKGMDIVAEAEGEDDREKTSG